MKDIRIAAAQFENHDNDKAYNLSRVRELTRRAVEQGAEIVSFHEVCIPAYRWIQPLNYEELKAVARYRSDAGWKLIDKIPGTPYQSPEPGYIWSTTQHSYKIIDVYPMSPYNTVKIKSEKNNESAYYTITLEPGEDVTSCLWEKLGE